MQLSDKHITEFQSRYKKYFGTDITKNEAFEKGSRLVRLFQIIYEPITTKKQCEVSKEDIENSKGKTQI